MKIRLNRFAAIWLVGTLISSLAWVGYWATPPLARAQDTAVAPAALPADLATASADQLKQAAYADIRAGKFQQTSDLLNRVAGLTHDANDITAAKWASQFQTICQKFSDERHRQFEKAVANVKLLVDKQHETYALDELSRAYVRADDKDAFRKEPWVGDLIGKAAALAKTCEEKEQWLRALRIYADLSSVEPASAEWKDKVKLVSRRVRLLMVYTPPMIKELQNSEAAERKVVEQLLMPTTQPTTTASAPATQPSNDDAATDWHDMVKGIEYGMLWDSLINAEKLYYRTVTFPGLLKGGLMGIRTMVTTPGLEHAFPELADKEKKAAFLKVIDTCQAAADGAVNATPAQAQDVLSNALDKLLAEDKQTVKIPQQVMVSEFADGALSTLDPFSTIIWPYDSAEFNKTTQGEFGGVGIQIESDAEGNLKIVSPLEDTPAFRAGIKAGEIITQIDHHSAKGILIDRAVHQITGSAGTPVTLTIRSQDGKERDVPLTREVIKVVSVKGFIHRPAGGWDFMIDKDNGIAYIRLTNFNQNTGDELNNALAELQRNGAKGIVLDLRNNPGGLLSKAIEVVNDFVKRGVIVSTHPDRKTANDPSMAVADPRLFRCDLPLVVLVNQYSASASEIVSGALKDHKRALIVGERTFGKGSVQMLYKMDYGPEDAKPALKLTTSHYYLPNGRCLHREETSSIWGVDPDVPVVMTEEQMRVANEARQELDVLRDPADTVPSTQPAHKDLLSVDAQLSAARLVLRLEISGAPL